MPFVTELLHEAVIFSCHETRCLHLTLRPPVAVITPTPWAFAHSFHSFDSAKHPKHGLTFKLIIVAFGLVCHVTHESVFGWGNRIWKSFEHSSTSSTSKRLSKREWKMKQFQKCRVTDHFFVPIVFSHSRIVFLETRSFRPPSPVASFPFSVRFNSPCFWSSFH